MGVREDISWLKENKKRWMTFTLIGTGKASKIRELRQQLNFDDWWPIKQHIRELIERGLITEVNDDYTLTENGKKVLESLRAVGYLKEV